MPTSIIRQVPWSEIEKIVIVQGCDGFWGTDRVVIRLSKGLSITNRWQYSPVALAMNRKVNITDGRNMRVLVTQYASYLFQDFGGLCSALINRAREAGVEVEVFNMKEEH